MTSSEGFQQHFSIILKSVYCGFYIKKNVAFTLISFVVLKCDECLWVQLRVIWVTVSDTDSVASRFIIIVTVIYFNLISFFFFSIRLKYHLKCFQEKESTLKNWVLTIYSKFSSDWLFLKLSDNKESQEKYENITKIQFSKVPVLSWKLFKWMCKSLDM